MPPTPEALRAALAALPVVVERVACTVADVAVPSYPDGPRPHGVVELAGGGHAGRGEHVGFTRAAQLDFAARAPRALPAFRGRVGDLARQLNALPPHDRAALEAAAIDLALRQRGATLFQLAGVAPPPVRYVVSFGRCADPAREARTAGGVAVKVDVDPDWPDPTLAALAGAADVAVLDWKGTGTRAQHERLAAAFPDALLEDPAADAAPWSATVTQRLSVDQALTAPDALDALPFAPVAANLKPARMGGVLPLLDAASRCAARGLAIYLGGMFELDVGRRQLHALAAVLCPDAPNDVAPVARDDAPAARPPHLVVDASRPGFGA